MAIFVPTIDKDNDNYLSSEEFLKQLKNANINERNAVLALIIGLSPDIDIQVQTRIEAEQLWDSLYKEKAYLDLTNYVKETIFTLNFVYAAAREIYIQRHLLQLNLLIHWREVLMPLTNNSDEQLMFYTNVVYELQSRFPTLSAIPNYIGQDTYQLATDIYNKLYKDTHTISFSTYYKAIRNFMCTGYNTIHYYNNVYIPENFATIMYLSFRRYFYTNEYNKLIDQKEKLITEPLIFTNTVPWICWDYNHTTSTKKGIDSGPVFDDKIAVESIISLSQDKAIWSEYKKQMQQVTIGLEQVDVELKKLQFIETVHNTMVAFNNNQISFESIAAIDGFVPGIFVESVYGLEGISDNYRKVLEFLIANFGKILKYLTIAIVGVVTAILAKRIMKLKNADFSKLSEVERTPKQQSRPIVASIITNTEQSVSQSANLTEDAHYQALKNDVTRLSNDFQNRYSIKWVEDYLYGSDSNNSNLTVNNILKVANFFLGNIESIANILPTVFDEYIAQSTIARLDPNRDKKFEELEKKILSIVIQYQPFLSNYTLSPYVFGTSKKYNDYIPSWIHDNAEYAPYFQQIDVYSDTGGDVFNFIVKNTNGHIAKPLSGIPIIYHRKDSSNLRDKELIDFMKEIFLKVNQSFKSRDSVTYDHQKTLRIASGCEKQLKEAATHLTQITKNAEIKISNIKPLTDFKNVLTVISKLSTDLNTLLLDVINMENAMVVIDAAEYKRQEYFKKMGGNYE